MRVKSGNRVVGYKGGYTGPGTRSQFGIDGPIRGPLFMNESSKNGASINPDDFCQLEIQGEMSIRVDKNC